MIHNKKKILYQKTYQSKENPQTPHNKNASKQHKKSSIPIKILTQTFYKIKKLINDLYI